MKKLIVPAALLLMALLPFTGCARKNKKPVTVTIWHVYGGQANSPLNDLIEEFNETAGREQNVNVQVTSVTTVAVMPKNLLAAARGEPGAADMPDMFSAYPDIVFALPESAQLVNYRDYFSDGEIAEFIPSFVEEGVIDGKLLILPTAKSTMVTYVNETLFDRFAAETGAKLSDLMRWETLFETAKNYAAWTDAKTPAIPNDGKCFLAMDCHFDYFQLAAESLGESLFEDGGLAYGSAFMKAWQPYAEAALSGGVWLYDGYATEAMRTGDAIVSIGSSASVLYYSDIVTYEDNASEKVKYQTFPSPSFKDGEKLAMQYGAGLCTVKSTPERERACMTFLKWLTEKEHNAEFAAKAGYMPVKQAAYESCFPGEVGRLTDPKYISIYETYEEIRKSYAYYTAPHLNNYLDLMQRFEKLMRLTLTTGRAERLESGISPKDAADKALVNFRAAYDK